LNRTESGARTRTPPTDPRAAPRPPARRAARRSPPCSDLLGREADAVRLRARDRIASSALGSLTPLKRSSSPSTFSSFSARALVRTLSSARGRAEELDLHRTRRTREIVDDVGQDLHELDAQRGTACSIFRGRRR
jgi:hypothetical protein